MLKNHGPKTTNFPADQEAKLEITFDSDNVVWPVTVELRTWTECGVRWTPMSRQFSKGDATSTGTIYTVIYKSTPSHSPGGCLGKLLKPIRGKPRDGTGDNISTVVTDGSNPPQSDTNNQGAKY